MKKLFLALSVLFCFSSQAQLRTGAFIHNGGNSGAVSIGTNDANDITIKLNNSNRWTFDNVAGYLRRGSGSPYFGLQLYSTGVGSTMTYGDVFDATTPYVGTREHGGTDTDQWEAFGQKGAGIFTGTYGGTARVWATQAGAVCINTETPVSGAELTVSGDADISQTLNLQGAGTFNSFTKYKTASTPSTPANGTEYNQYYKSGKFIIQYNDGGTTRYKYLDLTGTGATWIHTTTAP